MVRKRDPRTYSIIGSAIEVHRQLGTGFLEAVYLEALGIELEARGVPFRREVELPILYKRAKLRCTYRADFVCFDQVIVELKTLRVLSGVEEAQIVNYLKASGHQVGLLLNFGTLSLEYKRFVRSGDRFSNLRPSA